MNVEMAATNSKNGGDFMMEADNFKHTLKVTQIQRSGPRVVKANLRLRASENIWTSNDLREQSALFQARFTRCHKLLCYLACRVLGSPEQVHEVVEHCKITASRNPPTFECEGAFRSWLVRLLIDEALTVVRQRKSKRPTSYKSI